MRLRNKTAYRTGDLRRFVRAGLKAEGMRPELYSVEIVYNGRKGARWVTGLGWMNACWIRLIIPRDGLSPDEIKRVAQVLVHEVGHNQGLAHKDMVESRSIEVPWAEGLPIRLAEAKPATKRDLQAERAAHARAKLEEHERKLRRQQKLVRKYRRKVRYYERRRTAAAQR